AGARVAQHGNRAATSACGAGGVLGGVGGGLDLPPAATARLAQGGGVAFPFAPLYPPGCGRPCVTRRGRGVALRFPFLLARGRPVAWRGRRSAQAVGVAAPRMGAITAGVLAGRGCSALVFHGDDGLDELTTTNTSTVWVVHDGTVTQTAVDPADLGLARSTPE